MTTPGSLPGRDHRDAGTAAADGDDHGARLGAHSLAAAAVAELTKNPGVLTADHHLDGSRGRDVLTLAVRAKSETDLDQVAVHCDQLCRLVAPAARRQGLLCRFDLHVGRPRTRGWWSHSAFRLWSSHSRTPPTPRPPTVRRQIRTRPRIQGLRGNGLRS